MKRNIFVYITAFLCGMAIMAVELSASRLIAPFFGSSQTVWTIIIGIIMISLSIGNVLGGRAADKYNSGEKLYSNIWLASILIAIIPLVGVYIISASVPILMWLFSKNIIIAGSLFSCIVVFSYPLVILGMVSPYLVKLAVSSMEDNGKVTGEIYAISTIGSIVGTFIPTFLTIPVIGTKKTFLVFALLLNLLCVFYFVKLKKKTIRVVISAVIIAILVFLPLNTSYAFWKSNLVYEGESIYNYLQVYEDNESVILSTNVAFGMQSVYMKNQSLSGSYYDYALMAPFFIKNTDLSKKLNVLVLGMGTGTFAKQCKRYFPNSSIDGVEIDQKIVDLSKKYFHLTDSEANIFVTDGRTFLETNDAKGNDGDTSPKYDIIMIDAYRDVSIPFHMATREFFNQARRQLKKSGVLMININMRTKKNDEITDYLSQTLKSTGIKKVFSCIASNSTNTIVFASDDEYVEQNYFENFLNIDSKSSIYSVAQYVKDNLIEVNESKLVLTDDISSVESISQRILQEIADESALELKKSLLNSKRGIWGIFDVL